MKIELNNSGKKFRKEWIFRNLNYTFETNQTYAILGPNGSGKSTLLQAVSGIMPINEGIISYFKNEKQIDGDEIYKSIVFASPYLELIEEFTLEENLVFHRKLKPFLENISNETFLDFIFLQEHRHKPIKNFSSGMKQRLKLGLAFKSNTEILILDEPTSNLDENGINWYLKNIKNHIENRIVLIGSNDKREYDFCANSVNIMDFKI
jgi:ABC-type multidrug transport system ATPase subunit